MKVRFPLPAHMKALPDAVVSAFRGQWIKRNGDFAEAEIPEVALPHWQARWKAEPVGAEKPADEEPKKTTRRARKVDDGADHDTGRD